MLQIEPTQHFTGITIQGDFNDFYELVEGIYRMVGREEDDTDLYYGVKNRLLGMCYELRHAYMGSRDMCLKFNGMNEDIMKLQKQIAPAQNVYYSVNILFPEAVFLAAAVPKMYVFSSVYYGVESKHKELNLPPVLYSDYLRDQANLQVFCAGVWQALGAVIGDEELEKLIKLMHRTNESYIHYATHYVDKCNVELLKADVEKRKDKLRNIARRIVKKPQAYINMELDLKYWSEEYDTSVYDLYDPKLEYPESIEW